MSSEQISNRLIKVELKTQIKNRYIYIGIYIYCIEKSELDYFRKHYLLDGIITGMTV